MKTLHESISQATDGDTIPSALLTLLDVNEESRLQHLIWDIIDELDMMLSVVQQQEEVIERYAMLAVEILREKQERLPALNKTPDSKILDSEKTKVFERRKRDLLNDTKRRKKELEGLKQSAESTAKDVSQTTTCNPYRII